ncbi:MFS general substrate transporter [Canariomyces notabilis]|uniref:MFS general substrate transporter n=1 Tax=Canariomyces notabilis TaxID=2074819 RepID=A0AAN6QKQ3_9PEZI|nr:MFS general substrate transporter [Canariomyces arenarius]
MDESRTHDYGDPNQPCYKSPESSSSYSIRTEDSMRQTEGDLEPAELAGHEKDTLRAARREALQPTRRAFSFDGGQVRDEYFFSEPRPYHEPEESIRRACSFETPEPTPPCRSWSASPPNAGRNTASLVSLHSYQPSTPPHPVNTTKKQKGCPNPYNWSGRKKAGILLTIMMLIINSTMGSALPSNALPFIAREWNVTSQTQRVLPISIYLIGYVMGPILWGPLSEQFGRKVLTLCTFFMFTLCTLACALAPTWAGFLVFRLLTGVFASSPIAVVPGIIADTFSDPRFTVSGPLLAPIISGYTSPTIGWRWAFWIGLIYAGATLIPLVFLPETYGPVLLKRRAQAIRRRDPRVRAVAPHELDKKSLSELATVVLTRPLRMLACEPIVNTSCAYLALCYAIFYMSFEAFPVIFEGVYGFAPGPCGLTYLAVGVGCLLALPIFFAYDTILRDAQRRRAPWTRREESRRLPLACIGGPLFALSLFWLGWTARKDTHWAVPMLAGIPFGIGFMCIFQALLNYLTDAYSIYAASANAAASCSRSLLACLLPFAALPMFDKLGISGALSLLGGISTLMCVIPFLFLWRGERIRRASKFCRLIRERTKEMQRRVDEQRRRSAAASAAASTAALGASRSLVKFNPK